MPANGTRDVAVDVVVVGAGAAGLAAACEAAAHGLRVVLVEARDRVGGRVRWAALGTVATPADLGAEFVHGAAPETSAYLREAGLATVATSEASWECGPGGDLRPADDAFDAGDLFERARALGTDASVDAFLRGFETDPQRRDDARRARRFVEGFEAADPALASIRAIADELHAGVDDASTRPVDGYAPLFAFLAARCARAGVDVRLETAVERIAWRATGVEITTRDARDARAETTTLRARCAIVTVPLGVLQQRDGATPLAFEPPLPPAKAAGLAGLEMGRVVRVSLAFRTPFWETIAGGRYRDAAFFRCEGGAFDAFWTRVPLRERLVTAWTGGPLAASLDGLAEDERVARARDAFGAMLGVPELARTAFEAGATHDWSRDPYACGAYSYVRTGALAARAALATPLEGAMFFAGEATATDGQGGTVSGAFGTGLRAAREVARALAPGPDVNRVAAAKDGP